MAIEKTMLSGSKMLANRQSPWREGIANTIIANGQTVVQSNLDFDTREKELVFKRFNLEAQSLQEQQLNGISLTDNADNIEGIVQGFQGSVKEQIGAQKWGKEWLESHGSNFFAFNDRDVANAKRAKEKELNSLTMDKTLEQYADMISKAAPDKAAFLLGDAEGIIDGNQYLTPTEKQKSKDNFNKLSLIGMVNNSPEQAMASLSSGGFGGVSDIERMSSFNKAEKMYRAKIKDQQDMQLKQQKIVENEAGANVAKMKIDFLTGKIGREEALKNLEQYRDIAPEKVARFVKEINGGRASKEVSNEGVLIRLRAGLLDGNVSKTDIIAAEFNDELTKTDADNLINKGKQLGVFGEEVSADERALYQYLPQVADGYLTEGNIDTLFAEKEISKKVRDELIKNVDRIDKKNVVKAKANEDALKKEEDAQKLFMDNWAADLKLRISAKEEVDIDAEVLNAPDPLRATDYVKDVKGYQSTIFKATKEQAKTEMDKNKLEKDRLKEDMDKNKLDNYLAISDKINTSIYIDDIPSVSEVNALVKSEGIAEENAKTLRTAIDKKKKELAPASQTKKMSDGEKFINLDNMYGRYASLKANSEATQDDYQRLFDDVNRALTNGSLPKADGEVFYNTFSKEYYDKLDAMLKSQGDWNWNLFGEDFGYKNLDKWMGNIFKNKKEGKTEAEKKEAAMQNGRYAREKVKIQTMYRDNLVVEATKLGINNIDDIPQSAYKEEVWKNALAATKNQYMSNQYPMANVAAINPTSILSGRDGLVRVNSGQDDAGRGKKLQDSRIVRVGKDKNGDCFARFADGTARKIDATQYATLGGK